MCSIDINPIAVDYVKEKVTKGSVSNIEVFQADAGETDFPDEEFDLVFVFGLARSKGGALDDIWEEMYRILKHNGVLSVEGRVNPPDDIFELKGSEGRIDRFVKAQK